MEELFLKLLDMSVSASWLILAVIAARLLLRNAPKSVRCILWALVALRLACPASIPSPVSLAPQAPAAVEQILTAREVTLPRQIPTFRNQNGSTSDNAESADVTPKPESPSAPIRLTEIFSAVWLAGVSAMLLYALSGFLRLRRTVSASLPTGGNLWICDDIPAPFILGILRPRVYLPSNLDEAQARYVIAHENAHLRHYDHFWKPLGYALLSVYWFHPLVWVAYILFCRDLELACDERVVREMGLSERAAYSQALLDCSRERGSVAACPLAFGETGVRTRVKAVLNYRKPAFWIVIVSVMVCAALAACFLTSPPTVRNSAVSIVDSSVNSMDNTDGQPLEEAALTMRGKVEAGMTADEISRLTEFIKSANLWWEHQYFYDNIFRSLSDPDSLTWNYFDRAGEIQIGWAYDGTPGDKAAIQAREGLTDDEFYARYAQKVITSNLYDADAFSTIIADLKASVKSGLLDADFDRLINLCANAKKTHNVSYAVEMYHMLHDMDYFLLRYGSSDVGPYAQDRLTISKYYGSLRIWSHNNAPLEISVDPADYGITEAMLSSEDMPDFSALSLEALGAYFLHTDGAGAESSGEELYQRFMSDPDAVLHYLASLGGQKARGEDTAATELCREIANADVFWYGRTPEFAEILNEYSALYPDGPIAAVLEVLKTEYGAALDRDSSRVLSPGELGVSDNGNDGAARLVAEMPVPGGKLKQVELRVHHDFRGYDTVHELLMAPTGKEFGIESGYLLYSGETPPGNVVYDRKTETVTFEADGQTFVYDARSWAKD